MAYGVDFSVSNRWTSGFTGAITVRNANPTAANGWTVEFFAAFEITSIWDATIVRRTNGYYVVKNLAWNGPIPAGGEIKFGFQANGAPTPPSDISVNGQDIQDESPTLSVSDAALTEGDSGTKAARFTVTLSEASAETVTVRYATADGAATAGSDYTAKSGVLTFAPGQTRKAVTVAVRGDAQVEGHETFALKLSNPTKATIAKAAGTGTITNDDAPPPTLRVADVSVVEGTGGAKSALVTVTLTAPVAHSVGVSYTTANGAATAGADYTTASGRLVFSPGQTSKTVAIRIAADAVVEADEAFRVALFNPSGAAVSRPQATVTINNDDAPPPAIRVADATVVEGTGGAKSVVVSVTLSAAASGTVAVSYATANGTATAGADFTSLTGRLTFNPGETKKTVLIPIATDARVEGHETFKLVLSKPSGATLSRPEATVTVTNDDAARPTISVADASAAEGDPVAGGAGDGYFRTRGNDIVDAAGDAVKLAGVNWFGLESTRYAPDGLHTRNYQDMMDQMADLGFNAIRLPFSNQLFESGSRPGGIDYSRNPDLQGLTGLQIMDKIVDYAGEIGMKIILDHHRPSAGDGASANGLWYDAAYTEQDWIQTWTTLANRYEGDATVIGVDLHNEPHKGTWGGGGATDWAAAAERAGNAVLAANPNLLIFVEGVETYQNNYYWWGGNLMGVRDRPIQLDVPNRVVYSAHDYPNSIYAQPWFADPDFARTLPAKFDQMWGYIERENIAPVFIGELGSKLTDPKDLVWLDKITGYLEGDYDGDGDRDMPAGEQGANWTWWSWNPNSGDTGGILKDDWTGVHANKVASLAPLMFGGSGQTRDGETTMTFRVALSAPAATTVSVDYATAPGTAGAADFTAASGTLTFAPGQTTKTVAVKVRGDAAVEADEAFRFLLSNPRNADLGDGTASGRIVNDDAAAARMMTASVASAETGERAPEAAQSLFAKTTVTNAWSAGGVASIALRNTGLEAIEDWTITLETPLEITDIWNAEILSRAADEYIISAPGQVSRLAPGEEITFGFQATGAMAADAFDWTF